MFGFHAISQAPFSDVLRRAPTTIFAKALLASKFGYDSGFSAGFKSGTLMPVSLSAKSVMTIAASSSFANGFGLNADGVLLGDLVAFDAHLGTALLQSGSIFSSKGVLISVGKVNLNTNSYQTSSGLLLYAGKALLVEEGFVVSALTRKIVSELALALYIDQNRDITSYLDKEQGVILYLDKELNNTLQVDQSSSKTSYIDKELLVEI